MATKIQVRRDTAENWENENPVLAAGEFGYATNTKVLKVGDGITNWSKQENGETVDDLPAIIDGDYDFDENPAYVKTAGDATAQTITGAGGLDVEGLVEAGGGVKVTGGTAAEVDTGVGRVSNNQINIFKGGTSVADFGVEFAGGYNGLRSPGKAFSSQTNAVGFITDTAYYTNLPTGSELTGFALSFSPPTGHDASAPIKGFSVDGSATATMNAANNYAFYSNVNANNDSNKNNYNFYADGTAPNFFDGDTYIGGSVSRNTRELWESTLTEEQKEQLAASTLAIPANVSTPGDGSFVRQWWYDQQSAEDQALIDSGELNYPSHFQAANFVDTFNLGVTTNIDFIAADGTVNLKGIAFSKGATTADKIDYSGFFLFKFP